MNYSKYLKIAFASLTIALALSGVAGAEAPAGQVHIDEALFFETAQAVIDADPGEGTKEAIIETMERVYHPDIVKIGPDHAPLIGLQAVIDAEYEYFGTFQKVEFVRPILLKTLPGENKTIMHFDYLVVDGQGQRFYWDQISIQEWRDGKVIREKAWWDTRLDNAWQAPEQGSE